MRNKLIKSIAVISLILSPITMLGCREKTPSTAAEENTNVKSENPSTEKNALKQIKSIVQNHKATANTKVSDAKSFARISGYPPICDV